MEPNPLGPRITAEAMGRLRGYPWPGNIRELQSVLKQALLKSTGPVLIPAFLPESTPRTSAAPTPVAEEASRVETLIRQRLQEGTEDLYQEVHQQVDQLLLPLVLRSTGGNRLQAARILGITRRTLRLKLRELGLTITKSVEGGDDDAD